MTIRAWWCAGIGISLPISGEISRKRVKGRATELFRKVTAPPVAGVASWYLFPLSF
jgi:hypothetical protein